MILGRYVDGRDVTYDETSGYFGVGGTPVAPDAIRGYWMAGQLQWASADIAQWFQSAFPSAESTRRPALPTKPERDIFAVAALCAVSWQRSARS